ncbi:MAG: SPOR domain-containing protein [Pseudomonadota bacterium]
MMKVTRIVALIATMVGVSAGSLQAQSNPLPAEFPPASFKGTQYVDSRGCVFIRAGIDGNTTWVPRVNRQRSQICGQTPSLSQTAIAAARPAQPAAEAPEQITIDTPEPTPAPAPARTAPAPAPVVAAPRPAPKPVVRAAPKPAPRVVTAPKPPVAAPAPKPAPTQVARSVPAQPACRGGNAVSQRYINNGSDYPVRCGPQSNSPNAGAVARANQSAAPVVGVQTQAQAGVSQRTRVLPRQVFDARVAERDVAQVPEGYRPVWTDDRLNPRRAEQSLGGIAASRLVWTDTVPRRLVDQTTGQDVTAKVALVYPFTDMATQTRDLGTVTLVRRDGQLLKRIKRNRAKARTPTATPQPKPAAVAKPAAVSKPQAAAKGRYVQVGTFGVPDNAQRTAQRLVKAGVPARIGTLTRGGKSYRVVLAGPFDTRNGLNSGLQAARSMGFADAFVR